MFILEFIFDIIYHHRHSSIFRFYLKRENQFTISIRLRFLRFTELWIYDFIIELLETWIFIAVLEIWSDKSVYRSSSQVILVMSSITKRKSILITRFVSGMCRMKLCFKRNLNSTQKLEPASGKMSTTHNGQKKIFYLQLLSILLLWEHKCNILLLQKTHSSFRPLCGHLNENWFSTAVISG